MKGKKTGAAAPAFQPADRNSRDDRDVQAERIEGSFLDFVEKLLQGGSCIEVRPLTPGATVVDSVGGCSVVNGFTVRLLKDG